MSTDKVQSTHSPIHTSVPKYSPSMRKLWREKRQTMHAVASAITRKMKKKRKKKKDESYGWCETERRSEPLSLARSKGDEEPGGNARTHAPRGVGTPGAPDCLVCPVSLALSLFSSFSFFFFFIFSFFWFVSFFFYFNESDASSNSLGTAFYRHFFEKTCIYTSPLSLTFLIISISPILGIFRTKIVDVSPR